MPISAADQTVQVVNSGSGEAIPVTVVAEAAQAAAVTDKQDVTVDGTAGGVTLLAANTARKGAAIQNTGTANMRVTLDGSNPTASRGWQVSQGQALILTSPNCPTAAVKAIREGSSSTTAFAEETT